MKKTIIAALACIALTGCSAFLPTYLKKYDYQISPTQAQSQDPHYSVTVEPAVILKQLLGYTIVIENKSKTPIEIDWNKTLYMQNNQTSGGFMFEGVVFADRNNSKPNDIVLPGMTYRKIVYPNNLVTYDPAVVRYGASGWSHEPILAPSSGLYLTTKHDGEEQYNVYTFTVRATETSPF